VHFVKDEPQNTDPALYRRRHHIENMFGQLKGWRRIHTRYDRCAHAFFSAIAIAATSSSGLALNESWA